jgi:60 kDa SS-A/Ro ribonucleoprotein
MNSSATGNRGSVTSKTRCIDVAALFAASILRKNKDAEVIPFDTQVHDLKLNSYDSIMTNAKIFSKFNGGGTDCSCALRYLNSKKLNGDLVIMISDNQSWFESENYYHNATSSMLEWNSLVKRNPQAKLVNIDITPSKSTQTHERDDVLNIGGFSDQIFEVISRFSKLGSNKDMWIETIEAVEV